MEKVTFLEKHQLLRAFFVFLLALPAKDESAAQSVVLPTPPLLAANTMVFISMACLLLISYLLASASL